MEIECPKCNTIRDLDSDDLSSHACDSAEVECDDEQCGEIFNVGWYATAELR